MADLREDFEEVAKIYHSQNQVLRGTLGILATAVITFVPPSHTWLDLLARAAVPAAGTTGWVLYRGRHPVVSVAEVHDLISWWENRNAARDARRSNLTAPRAARPVIPRTAATPDAAQPPSPPATTSADPAATQTPPANPTP